METNHARVMRIRGVIMQKRIKACWYGRPGRCHASCGTRSAYETFPPVRFPAAFLAEYLGAFAAAVLAKHAHFVEPALPARPNVACAMLAVATVTMEHRPIPTPRTLRVCNRVAYGSSHVMVLDGLLKTGCFAKLCFPTSNISYFCNEFSHKQRQVIRKPHSWWQPRCTYRN